MNLSFAKDSRAFSEAVESLRGNTPLTEENIKAAYDKIVASKGEGKKSDAPTGGVANTPDVKPPKANKAKK